MQKKLIALAVAGLMAAPAFAQSNVTIYGRFDIGFQSRSGDNGGLSGDLNGETAMDTGLQGGNRIGFKGAEDLGNGLKAVFEMEFGSIKNDIGSGGINGNRHSYLGLAGGFGTVVAGRLDGVRYGIYNKYDPFAGGNLGNLTQITAQVDRADNAIAYISPAFGGLTAVLAYSTNVAGAESSLCSYNKSVAVKDVNDVTIYTAAVPTNGRTTNSGSNCGNDGDLRLNTAMLAYANGPIAANIDWERVYQQGSDLEVKVFTLGGSYDFGPVKVSALYDVLKADGVSGKATDDVRTWLIGAKAPLTSNLVLKAVYGKSKQKEDGNGVAADATAFSACADNTKCDVKKFGIGLDYLLSKRTNIYASYGSIRNSRNAGAQLSAAANSGGGGLGVRGFDLGIAHKF